MKATFQTFLDLKTVFDLQGKEVPDSLVVEVERDLIHELFKMITSEMDVPKIGQCGRILGIRFRIVE